MVFFQNGLTNGLDLRVVTAVFIDKNTGNTWNNGLCLLK